MTTLSRYRYEIRGSNGATGRRCFIECDSDASSLVLPSGNNDQATAGSTSNTFNFLMKCEYFGRGDVARPRYVVLEYTGTTPPGQSGILARVPIFNRTLFVNTILGHVGTYKGLPVVVTGLVDGVPDKDGQF